MNIYEELKGILTFSGSCKHDSKTLLKEKQTVNSRVLLHYMLHIAMFNLAYTINKTIALSIRQPWDVAYYCIIKLVMKTDQFSETTSSTSCVDICNILVGVVWL